jgi:hypothetical protein
MGPLYTYDNEKEWEVSLKKVLWGVLILVAGIAVSIVFLYWLTLPKYQDQINQALEVEQNTNILASTEVNNGVYRYREFIPPGQTWDYLLVLDDQGKAKVTIAGLQVDVVMNVQIEVKNGHWLVLFDSYEKAEGGNQSLRPGNVLFSLRPISATRYEVTWQALEPIVIGKDVRAEFIKVQ